MIRWFLLSIAFWAIAVRADFPADFEAANRLYEKGEYSAAAAAYQKIVSGGQTSAPLLFNLGNAQFKNGRPGLAIAAYSQAAQLAPRDPDIRANLQFVRNSVPGNATRVTGVDRALNLLTLNELGVFTTLSLWLCFGSLAMAQFRPALKSGLKTIAVGAGIFAIFFGGWYAQALSSRVLNQRVVVTARASAVRFGPLEESQVSFNVRDGIELKALGQKDKWTQVVDPANRTGWIPTADITTLR
jgi:tetratricopeptide (TPR) repeat protein